MLLHPQHDNFEENRDTREKLERDLCQTQKSVYAPGTLKNIICQWNSFLRFSKKYRIYEWPVSEHTLCLFAQHLSYTFHSAKSVRSYLSGIKTIHVLSNVKPPDMKNVEVRLTLRGLNRILNYPVKQAQPLTPEILSNLYVYLDMNKRKDLVFWGLLLVGFFAMLRKSNLVSDTKESFNGEKQLTRGHVTFSGNIAILKVTWAKNIQFRERVLEIPLFPINNSLLCPVTTLKAILSRKGKDSAPLFGSGSKPLFTYSSFQRKFRGVLNKAGYRGSLFSSHSMRRGGAGWAHRSGVPGNLIQIHGSWLSDAYKCYLTFPIEVRVVVSIRMCDKIAKLGL